MKLKKQQKVMTVRKLAMMDINLVFYSHDRQTACHDYFQLLNLTIY